MNFVYQELDADREYYFLFDNELYYNNPSPGTWKEMCLEVKIPSSGKKIHRAFVVIKEGKLLWHEYHVRKDHPLISETARAKAQQILDNKAFW